MNIKQKNHLTKIQNLNRIADSICKAHKECDRDNILHTLLCLEQTPIKKLEMSIRRANFSIYSKRN